MALQTNTRILVDEGNEKRFVIQLDQLKEKFGLTINWENYVSVWHYVVNSQLIDRQLSMLTKDQAQLLSPQSYFLDTDGKPFCLIVRFYNINPTQWDEPNKIGEETIQISINGSENVLRVIYRVAAGGQDLTFDEDISSFFNVDPTTVARAVSETEFLPGVRSVLDGQRISTIDRQDYIPEVRYYTPSLDEIGFFVKYTDEAVFVYTNCFNPVWYMLRNGKVEVSLSEFPVVDWPELRNLYISTQSKVKDAIFELLKNDNKTRADITEMEYENMFQTRFKEAFSKALAEAGMDENPVKVNYYAKFYENEGDIGEPNTKRP